MPTVQTYSMFVSSAGFEFWMQLEMKRFENSITNHNYSDQNYHGYQYYYSIPKLKFIKSMSLDASCVFLQ